MCPVCKGKLVNIIYGPVNDLNLMLHQSGEILLAGDQKRYGNNAPAYYCHKCEESFELGTVVEVS